MTGAASHSSASPPPPTALFSNLSREHGFEPARVEGQLPEALRGTLYRNGPGLLELFGRRYSHLFEGDGAISAVRFEGGRALAAARVIQSAGLVEERVAGRHLGSFAAAWPTRVVRTSRGRMKNTANTHVIPWQGGLYALMEGGKPTRLDPDTLDTLGETDLGGVIGGAFSAHPHRVHSRRALYGFGLSYAKQTTLSLYELPDAGRARRLAELPLPRPVMLHDFIATERHLVFFVSPIQLRVWRLTLALGTFSDAFRWAPEDGTEVIVVPIEAPADARRFRTDAFCQFHFAGAFEDGADIVVDYVRYPDSSLLGALGDGLGLTWTDSSRHVLGSLHRARVTPSSERLESAPLISTTCEFPQIARARAGARYRHLWVQSQRTIDGVLRHQITRVDTEGGTEQHHLLGPGEHCSEPVLAQPGAVDAETSGPETAGWVLALVFDSFSAKSHVLVLSADTLEEVARVELEQAIPLTFHGSWVEGNGT